MASVSVMYFPCLVLPYQRVPGLWYTPESVLTQTIPAVLVGAGCADALEEALVGAVAGAGVGMVTGALEVAGVDAGVAAGALLAPADPEATAGAAEGAADVACFLVELDFLVDLAAVVDFFALVSVADVASSPAAAFFVDFASFFEVLLDAVDFTAEESVLAVLVFFVLFFELFESLWA